MQQRKPASDTSKNQLTPTQLRNARKRRAKQLKRQQLHQRNDHKRRRGVSHEEDEDHYPDPSLQYIKQPTRAPTVQQAKQFFSSKLDSFEIHSGPKHHWRTLVKLAVRDINVVVANNNTHIATEYQSRRRKRQLCLGLFAKKSHELIPNSCTSPLHHPKINQAMERLEQLARSLNVPAFQEGDQKNNDDDGGDPCLKYATASLERRTQKVQLTLIWQERKDKENSTLHRLTRALINEATTTTKTSSENTLLQSLWVHYHPCDFSIHNNSIYAIDGGRWETIFGPSHGTMEHISRGRTHNSDDEKEGPSPPLLYFPPNVFRQANIDAFSSIVQQIQTFLQKEALDRLEQEKLPPKILELYGGVGTIGLNLAHLCSSLICSDENPHNLACFEKSVVALEKTNPSAANSCRYVPHNATDMVRGRNAELYLHEADWIVVDPPRKGLEPVVCQALCSAQQASVLVYVSCGFAAFARDFQQLVRGGWNLVQASGHLLFPGSDVIETLAIFRYNPPS